jgi:hypothetical protein
MQVENLSAKHYALHYFELSTDEKKAEKGVYVCKYCSKERIQLKGTGYQNLFDHVQRQHKDYASVVKSVDNTQPTILSAFTTEQGTIY